MARGGKQQGVRGGSRCTRTGGARPAHGGGLFVIRHASLESHLQQLRPREGATPGKHVHFSGQQDSATGILPHRGRHPTPDIEGGNAGNSEARLRGLSNSRLDRNTQVSSQHIRARCTTYLQGNHGNISMQHELAKELPIIDVRAPRQRGKQGCQNIKQVVMLPLAKTRNCLRACAVPHKAVPHQGQRAQQNG